MNGQAMNRRVGGNVKLMDGVARNERRWTFFKGTHILQLLVLFLLSLNLLLIYGLFFSGQGIWAYRQQCAQVKELESKVQKLKRENHRLFSRIQAFKKDPQAQERLVRQQLGWVRSNEMVVEFAPPTSEPRKP